MQLKIDRTHQRDGDKCIHCGDDDPGTYCTKPRISGVSLHMGELRRLSYAVASAVSKLDPEDEFGWTISDDGKALVDTCTELRIPKKKQQEDGALLIKRLPATTHPRERKLNKKLWDSCGGSPQKLEPSKRLHEGDLFEEFSCRYWQVGAVIGLQFYGDPKEFDGQQATDIFRAATEKGWKK